MKLLFTIIVSLLTLESYALTDRQVADFYSSNKLEEKTFKEVRLSAPMKKAIILKMEKTAEYLSNVWADTVLEGPYSLLSVATLDEDSISALYYKNKLVGFSGYVRADAAFNEECSYNDELNDVEAEAAYTECLQDYKGSISELFLVNESGDYIGEYAAAADFED